MKIICAWCHQELKATPEYQKSASKGTSHGICPSCQDYFFSGETQSLSDFLNNLTIPVFAVDNDGVILLANLPALQILGKDLSQVQNQRGGDAMECAYARLPGGCGFTVHCKACTIRRAVMRTFESGESLERVTTHLNRRVDDEIIQIRFLIATQKMNDVVLLRIDEIG